MTDVTELPLAVYRRRPVGEVLTAEIEGGMPPRPPSDAEPQGHPGLPALVVRFRVPGPEDLAVIEARCREAMVNLIQGRGSENRYGLAAEGVMDENTISALSPFIAAVESAAQLFKDWNLGFAGPDGRVLKEALSPQAIAELFRGRPLARAGWMLQYDGVSPLERAEGNVSAASPNTTSAMAANTVEGATRPDPAAAEAVSAGPGGRVPEP